MVLKRKMTGIYSIFVGVSVIALWLMILGGGQEIPEGKTEMGFQFVFGISDGNALYRQRHTAAKEQPPGQTAEYIWSGHDDLFGTQCCGLLRRAWKSTDDADVRAAVCFIAGGRFAAFSGTGRQRR
jgi:hypothetical protein